MTNQDSILKSRDITLPTTVHIVKAMVFLVVTYELEKERASHSSIIIIIIIIFPLKYSCLENSMDKGAWQAIVHRVSKSQT